MFEPVQPKYIKAVAGFSSIFYIPFSLSLSFSHLISQTLSSLSYLLHLLRLERWWPEVAPTQWPASHRGGAPELKKLSSLFSFFFCAFSRLPPLYTVCVCVCPVC
ncbi:hypothetical protein MtrunA17_Chr1g0167851 [Medicago truncatula]|uniref:Transmembrane protein n=1 Tax=Medicago truncatula TaxID=3880 RepID=A0A396JN42_MEDTR|nr:hypothetical protein MtrunA17_Chr1g0167851 [Medicago truncatula]